MALGKPLVRRLAPWLAVAAGLGLLWLGLRLTGPATVGPWVGEWYSFLSNLYLLFGVPLNDLARQLNMPIVSALLLGIVGALSPCQLTTGAAALAYLAPQVTQTGRLSANVMAYLAGKVFIYSLLGGAVLFAGFQFNDSIPVIQTVRKTLGPLMLVLGLHFLGIVRFDFAPGQRLSLWLEDRFAGSGVRGAFALGVAFSLAFCPTLFLLFFGLLLPLALTRPLGIIYPGLFALGTTVPLLVLAACLSIGVGSVGQTVRRAGSLDRGVRWTSAGVLLLAGLNDTVVYWFV